ncbi:MAG: RNA polymerase sigma factor [Bacteroidia bacterium]|nr:RNA polymerase sigma factor [Bacteroidia bacterium]
MRFFKPDYNKCSDEELMELIVKQDERAFDTLYVRYSERMLNFFYRMLNRDENKSQDFLQDLFMKLLEKPYLFKKGNKFSTWIYTIASNMVKNEYRSLQVRKIVSKMEDLSHLPIGAWMDDGDIDRQHFKMVLEKEIQNLSPKHREVFFLRFREELSIKEISEITACSEGTIKSRIFYALKRLAQNMQVFDPKRG